VYYTFIAGDELKILCLVILEGWIVKGFYLLLYTIALGSPYHIHLNS